MQMKTLLQSEGFFKLVTLFGAVCALGSVIFGWGGIQFGINLAITKMMRLVPGSTTWETWKTIPLPVYIKFSLFNITNPEEMATKGAKPHMSEMGPYVYLVDFDKFDFARNDTIDTILFTPSRTYYFQPDKSKGKEDDLVTYVNIMFVAMSHFANDFTDISAIHETLDEMLVEKGEKLTRTDKVKDLLFHGVSIQAYLDLLNEPLVQQAGGSISLPKDYADGFFALFKGKNGTKDGRWEVHSGIRDSAELTKIYRYNGKRKLSLYKGDSCNSINGTDGTLNPPFIIPGETELNIFIPELCRSIRWEFLKEVDANGIPAARHRFPKITTPSEDPNLACFCPKDNTSECAVQGIANLAACFDGAPLLYSKPHFLQVHKSIRDQVDGLRPNPLVHESRLDVHPLTGVAVTASVKMQFSIELIPWESMPSFRKASKAIIPFVWVELLAELTGFSNVIISMLCLFLKLLPILRWLGLLGSLGILFLGFFFGYRCRKNKNSVTSMQDSEEDEQDAKTEHEMWLKKFNKKHGPDSDDETVIK